MAELRREQREKYVCHYIQCVQCVCVRGLGMVLLALCEFRLYRSMRLGKMVWNSV